MLDGLAADTLYEVRVIAYNFYGASLPSDSATVQTLAIGKSCCAERDIFPYLLFNCDEDELRSKLNNLKVRFTFFFFLR